MVRRAQHTGGVQGRDLAVGVTRDRIRGDPELIEHRQQRQAGRADGRLGPLRRCERGGLRVSIRVGERRWRERELVHSAAVEALSGDPVPHVARCVDAHRHVGAHADVLRALAWEQERDAADRGSSLTTQPLWCVDGFARGDVVRSGAHLRREVRAV